MDGFTKARIVHFVLPNGVHRPAIIVEDWEHLKGSPSHCEGYANLQVFTDGSNDVEVLGAVANSGIVWMTSKCFSEGKEPGTWHWPERA